MNLTISIDYTCKYCISFAQNYVFTTCGLCYNTKTKRVIKQVVKSNCIGYIVKGKFNSLTFLKNHLIEIPKLEKTPF